MSGFLPAWLLSCWEAQFPRLLYVPPLKFSVLIWKPCQPQSNQYFWDQGPLPHAGKWLACSLQIYLQDDICHHTESQNFRILTHEICSGCLSSILLQILGTKWTRNLASLLSGQIVQWTVGTGRPRTNKIPSNLILLCKPQH